MIKDNKYLYGKYAKEILNIDEKVINSRIEALKKHLDDIQKTDYLIRDFTRLFDVANAIEFWEDFLKKQKEV